MSMSLRVYGVVLRILHLEFADGADRLGTVWKEPQAEPAAGEDGLINLSRDSLCGLSLFLHNAPPLRAGGRKAYSYESKRIT